MDDDEPNAKNRHRVSAEVPLTATQHANLLALAEAAGVTPEQALGILFLASLDRYQPGE
jgi:hypothetical protein